MLVGLKGLEDDSTTAQNDGVVITDTCVSLQTNES